MITIETKALPVIQALQTLQGRMTDMTPVMANIGQRFEARVRTRFETETDPLGNAWAPWAASYDPAQGGNRPDNGNTTLLDLYGDMLGGLSHRADANSVTIGFNQDYAVYHEYGTRTMPRRGMLTANPNTGELAPDDVDDILDVLQAYLAQPL